MTSPLLENKSYTAESVFTAQNLLREARRQKSIASGLNVPSVCVLDPDGDLAQYLLASRQAIQDPAWACYHTLMYSAEHEDIRFGVVPYAVGSAFAVLVAEQLFASGCQLLISMTSAGQISALQPPPYFVLIERALRDEGTSHHYLPPASYSVLSHTISQKLVHAFESIPVQVLRGDTWTTDAPYRETETAISYAQSEGILGVEMEAAALYAFAEAKGNAIVCFAHITNQMAQIDGDFEKGENQGSSAALHVLTATAKACLR
jgi:uridine phosphorylase